MIKIPPSLKIKNKVVYEVVHSRDFIEGDDLGQCRFDVRQIVLSEKQSKIQEKKTFIHEVLHAICFERKIDISHKAIYQLEDAIYYIITRNKF